MRRYASLGNLYSDYDLTTARTQEKIPLESHECSKGHVCYSSGPHNDRKYSAAFVMRLRVRQMLLLVDVDVQ